MSSYARAFIAGLLLFGTAATAFCQQEYSTAKQRIKYIRDVAKPGGSSAISNLGMYGVREFSAIINPPHATILAVGATRRAPVEAEDGSVKFISQMSVTVSCDHRVVDGALGAELLAAFKRFVEQPVTMMV